MLLSMLLISLFIITVVSLVGSAVAIGYALVVQRTLNAATERLADVLGTMEDMMQTDADHRRLIGQLNDAMSQLNANQTTLDGAVKQLVRARMLDNQTQALAQIPSELLPQA